LEFWRSSSGIANTSKDLSPFHDFSNDGKYTITARVIGKDGTVEVLTEIIDAKEPPKAYVLTYLCM
jgi:PKD repeat protein